MRKPLYPHIPSSKREPLYPHVKSTKGAAETGTPEIIKLTGDIWDTMTPVERENLRVKALAASSFTDPTSLDVSKYWLGYWGEEKRALIREFKKEQVARGGFTELG